MTSGFLVLDLDGTILDKTSRLDPAVVAAVRGAVGRGLPVTLATGRMPAGARPYWEELGIRAPVILYNGGLIRDPASGADLLREELPAGLAWSAFAAFANAPVHPLFFRGDALYCLERTFPVAAYCEEQGLAAEEIAEPESFLSGTELSKCLFMGHPDVLPIVREDVLALVGPLGRLVLSRPDYLELVPAGASKGRALEWLARWLEIPVERAIAVGDQENDLDMIRAAGVGIAMAHAPASVRAEADRVAPVPAAGGLLALLAELLPDHFGLTPR
jgi:Cof subfamily protein (haloacid dehalogenase superfamily)